MKNLIDVLPGSKTYIIVIVFVCLNLVNKYAGGITEGVDVTLVNNILYALGLGAIRLSIDRK